MHAAHLYRRALSVFGQHARTPDDANNPIRSMMGNGMRPDVWMNFKQRFGLSRDC